MKNFDLQKINDITQGVSKLAEAANWLGKDFIKTKDDFLEVGGMAKQLIGAYNETQALDQKHTLIKGHIEKMAGEFKLKQMFLENVFAERKDVIHKHFDAIDHGIATGNDEIILNALAQVAQFVNTNPFQDFQAFKKALDNDDEVLYLDF
jgi:hypothetical protein